MFPPYPLLPPPPLLPLPLPAYPLPFHPSTSPAGDDFGLFPTPFMELTALLLSNETQLQFGVQVMDDSIVEGTESFVARLQLPSDPNMNPAGLQIGLDTTSVDIIDNDCKWKPNFSHYNN